MKTVKHVVAMSKNQKILMVALLLAVAALRFHGLFANTFHPDEALFARWARIVAVGRDPLLATQAIDKPPLLFYLQALFYPLMGTPAAWVARLPNLIASLLLVPLTGRLTWALYRDGLATFVAVAFVALSPFTVQFSATAFTDPLMVGLLTGSLVAAVTGRGGRRGGVDGAAGGCGPAGSEDPASSKRDRPRSPDAGTGETAGGREDAGGHRLERGRAQRDAGPSHGRETVRGWWGWQLVAGLLFGLAAVSKYQAWLFLPLVVGMGALRGWGWPAWRRWLAGLLMPLLALFLWDLARTESPALWSLQLGHYGGVRPAWSWELWPRLAAWGELWAMVLGSPVLAFLLVLALPVFLALLIYHQDWATAYDQFFLLFVLGYVAIHWFLAVPVWDRYLLPLVPLAGVLLGRFLSRVVAFMAPDLPWSGARRWLVVGAAALPVLMALPAAIEARQGAFPVGGRPAADSGAAEIAATLADATYGTVLYDHWYSWQWRYYLFDSGVYVSWFPHPDALAQDLRAFAEEGDDRYVALPSGAVAQPVHRAVTEAGFKLRRVHAAGDIILYRVVR